MAGCSFVVQIYSIILVIICIILLLSTFPIIYEFVKKHKHETKTISKSIYEKKAKRLFYVGLLFIISTVLALTSDIAVHILICHENQTIQYLFASFYIIQFYFLLLLLFMRVNAVFSGTPFRLSNITVTIYRALYVLTPLTLIMSIIMFYINTLAFVMFAIISVLMIMILIISIMLFFIYKLINVYKLDPNGKMQNDELINVITKNAVLTFVSLFMTFLQIIAIIMQSFAPNIIGVDPTWLTTIVDIYTNFLCLLLTYNEFTNYYYKLCKYFDDKCKLLCNTIVGGDTEMIQAQSRTKVGINADIKNANNVIID